MRMDSLFRHIFLCLTIVCVGLPIQAEPGGIYFGASATLQQAEVLYGKTVLSQFTDTPGTSTRSTDTAVEEKPLQWDGLVGLRLNFAEGTQFMALQAELSLVGDDISGRLDGNGDSPGQNLLGEAWPEDWKLETTRSIGLIAKYGLQRSLFGALEFSVYGLAGIRQTTIDFFSSFHGCFLVDECSVDDFRTDTQSLDPNVNLAVAGLGLETGIGSKTAFQFEIRFVEDFESEWVADFTDDAYDIKVPAGFTVKNTDFGVKLIRYF